MAGGGSASGRTHCVESSCTYASKSSEEVTSYQTLFKKRKKERKKGENYFFPPANCLVGFISSLIIGVPLKKDTPATLKMFSSCGVLQSAAASSAHIFDLSRPFVHELNKLLPLTMSCLFDHITIN